MRPKLEDFLGIQLFPHCYVAKFAMYESSNNLELVTAMVPLQVEKNDTLTKLLPFAYVKRPWELLQIMLENSIVDHLFQPSGDWMCNIYCATKSASLTILTRVAMILSAQFS